MSNVVRLSGAQSSASGDAILTTDYSSDTIVRGQGFSFSQNFTLGIGASLFVLWDFRTFDDLVNQAGVIYILPPFFQTTKGYLEVKVYDGGDYAGGTALRVFNPNALSPRQTPQTTITSGATGSDNGTLFFEMIIGGDSQGNQSSAGASKGTDFFVRSNKGKSLVEIINFSAAEIKLNYSETFFEL